MTLLEKIKPHSLELQFWGYESGNVLASIAGVGGLALFWDNLKGMFSASQGEILLTIRQLAIQHPETIATIGVLLLVVLGHPLGRFLQKKGARRAADVLCVLVICSAVTLLGYAIFASAHWFTLASCVFVLSSCLLRSAGRYPLLLKLGGIGLSWGGFFLLMGGLTMVFGDQIGRGLLAWGLGGATVLSGFFVAGAGVLTFQGGCFVISAMRRNPRPHSLFASGLHPTAKLGVAIERYLDGPMEWIASQIVSPALIWIPVNVRATQPFYTSMMARLPWRFLTAALAILTGTPEGLCFAAANCLWIVGDLAIGALDAQPTPELA